MRHRLGFGMRQVAHLFIGLAHLAEAVDAEGDVADAASEPVASVGINTIW